MNFIFKLLMLLLPLVVSSCVSDDIYDIDNRPQPSLDVVEAGTTELRLGVPITRATVDANLDLKWQRGDRITLLAYDGATQIFSKTASFWAALTDKSSVGTQAYFKAKFDSTTEADALSQLEAMADGKCYAISPVKGVTISGTTATINIPSVQTGEYQDAPDFMTARSSSISELKLCAGGTSGTVYDPADSKYINDIDLTFTHHTHAFRVTIPSNNLGREVTKAYVKFPFAVAGDLTVDYTTGAVTAVNNTSDLVVVEFSEPKTAGDEFWVFINGVENKGEVDIRFQTADGTYTERRVATFSQKNWVAGAVSKVKMSIPVATTTTTISCTVPNYSQLGEPVTNLHFTLSDGYFTDYTTTKNAASSNGVMQYTIFSDLIDSSFRLANHSLTFESASAIVPNPDPIVFGDAITAGEVNNYELTAPYLFEENFNDAVTVTNADTSNAELASPLTGWTASRYGVDKAIMMHVYQGTSTSSIDNKRSRVDSPTLPTLKPTANVSLKVVCNYGGTLAKGTLSDPKIMQSVIEIGSTTKSGVISYSENLENTYFSADAGSDGSYTNTPNTATVTIPNFTASHRISWRGSFRNHSGSSWSVITSLRVYVYFDNVKVSIVQ